MGGHRDQIATIVDELNKSLRLQSVSTAALISYLLLMNSNRGRGRDLTEGSRAASNAGGAVQYHLSCKDVGAHSTVFANPAINHTPSLC